MNKNKLLLTLGAMSATLAISSPLLAASCKKEDVIRFDVTFSRGKDQWNALDDVIKVYNAKVDEYHAQKNKEIKELEQKIAKAKKEDKKEEKETLNKELEAKKAELSEHIKVKLDNIGSGYGAGHNSIVTNLKNNNISSLPNITVNYGSTISEIVNYGKQVDISNKAKFGNLAIERNSLDERFTKTNDKISGVQPGGLYSVPFFKSTVAFGINGPIYKYVFKTLKEAGLTIDSDLTKQFKLDDDSWTEDIDVIKGEGYFGNAKSKEEIKKIFTHVKYPKMKINADIFKDFSSLLKFITDAIQIFEKSSNVSKSSVALLGIDDPSGIINTTLYSNLNHDDSKMLMAVTNSGGTSKVNFENIKDSNSDVYKAFKELYDLMKEAIQKGALKIFGGGSYSSSDQVQHKLGGNFGSTVGYTHNFTGNRSVIVAFNDGPTLTSGKVITNSKNALIFMNDNTRLLQDKVEDNDAGVYLKAEKEVKDKILKLESDTQIIYVKSGDANLAKIKELVKDKQDFEEIGEITQVKRSFAQKADGTKDTKLTDTETKYTLFQIKATKSKEESGKYKITIGNANSLQEEELVVITPPQKLKKEDKNTSAFLQGPNLFVIDKGDRHNKATMNFLKFMTDLQNKHIFGKSKTKMTAFDYISKTASYVIPYKGFEEKVKSDKSVIENKYVKLANELFVKQDITWYEEPNDKNSSPFRESLNAILKSSSESIRIGKAAENDFEKIVSNIKEKTKGLN
ncbi:Mycoplasma MG185/MG260 protein [Mycoplasmopsis bovigenitalium]|uniref:Mycoplasma MG185/MG260 protein n=1 Tax=Mycoplasmopsis bovigenitalium TaxID=2112 RepID=A0A449A956_9BACT|nr:P80 family lipoprotein [Mycoplasmopsis bovigenitalium]VEU60805.1 Mycoplasma MG185/MG260 protein [Mycoplasmopsis bovigenitalium]